MKYFWYSKFIISSTPYSSLPSFFLPFYLPSFTYIIYLHSHTQTDSHLHHHLHHHHKSNGANLLNFRFWLNVWLLTIVCIDESTNHLRQQEISSDFRYSTNIEIEIWIDKGRQIETERLTHAHGKRERTNKQFILFVNKSNDWAGFEFVDAASNRILTF